MKLKIVPFEDLPEDLQSELRQRHQDTAHREAARLKIRIDMYLQLIETRLLTSFYLKSDSNYFELKNIYKTVKTT